MPLQLYNTATRRKEPFTPLKPDTVGMYVCGPTVYDRAHIGNARPVIVFDVLYRLLKRHYGHVTYVRNITDVDDKIIAAARQNGEPIAALTERTTQAFHDDMAALGALPPDEEPRATQHIDGMIAMTATLIDKGHAYEADGHVLFDVTSMAEYGKLSGRDRDEQIAGARVEVAPYKRDPADFVLWKPSDADQPGWYSPWGRGRPGWHLECSVMSHAHLGATFDIHGGGRDLIFPHHENEVAQSEGVNGAGTFARTWVHNGFLTVNGEKMSKSLGNFFTVRDLLDDGWPGEALRLMTLKTHYRHPLDWTLDGLKEAKAELDHYYLALRHADDVEAAPDAEVPQEVEAALLDDLNTPQALTALHAVAGELNKVGDGAAKVSCKGQLLAAGAAFGLLRENPETWLKGAATDDAGDIDALIAARNAARHSKDFAEADRIRDELAARGVVLEDGAGGTTWRRAG